MSRTGVLTCASVPWQAVWALALPLMAAAQAWCIAKLHRVGKDAQVAAQKRRSTDR